MSILKFYNFVIEDVVKNVRTDFQHEGVDERVLQLLRHKWEEKLHESLLPDETQQLGRFVSSNSSFPAPTALEAMARGPQYGAYSQAPATINYTPHSIQQTDGPGGTRKRQDAFSNAQSKRQHTVNTPSAAPHAVHAEYEPEEDADADDFENAIVQAVVRGATEVAPAPAPATADDDDTDAGEEDLGSDLDEPDSEDEEADVQDLVLAQFEKVTRAKNRWKSSLKDGIMHIGGREFVFSKASGEFDWS